MSTDLLWIFIPTIAAISLTPGMCMTLAFTVGLSQGYRHTLWMMWGELAGVATVVVTCVVLLAWIQVLPKAYFTLLALIGGAYLLWVAYRLWTAPARFEQGEGRPRVTPAALLAPSSLRAGVEDRRETPQTPKPRTETPIPTPAERKMKKEGQEKT